MTGWKNYSNFLIRWANRHIELELYRILVNVLLPWPDPIAPNPNIIYDTICATSRPQSIQLINMEAALDKTNSICHALLQKRVRISLSVCF